MYDLSRISTPFYLYDLNLLEKTVFNASMAAGDHGILLHYAIKANHETKLLSCMQAHGLGIDCVSGNEVRKALAEGFNGGQIVFAGVGKTDEDIRMAIGNDILALNAESLEEVYVIAALAQQLGRVANVAIRVNPGVDARTHKYITTGLDENKFGIALRHLKKALEFCHGHANIRFAGLHFHIGSQITTHAPYIRLCETVNQIWREFELQRYGAVMLNLGGGLGIDYDAPFDGHPDFNTFFSTLSGHLDVPRNVAVHAELGRSLVGQCGSLITRVLFVKEGSSKMFVVTDAGMTELMRPALYQARHHIDNLSSRKGLRLYDVVGPVCESSDVFARNALLPATSRGDLLAIRSCGAYAQSMSLRYNLRDEAKGVFLRDGSLLMNGYDPEQIPATLV